MNPGSSKLSRITIDVTPEQYEQLKTLAARHGKSVEQLLLSQALKPDNDIAELEALLDERLRNARAGRVSQKTVGDIVAQLKRELSGDEPAA